MSRFYLRNQRTDYHEFVESAAAIEAHFSCFITGVLTTSFVAFAVVFQDEGRPDKHLSEA